MPNPAPHEDAAEFVEVDPTGRYGRYSEVLGKGASKTVYKAFDEIEGIEVAWNQVKLHTVLKTPEDLQRLCSEVHLLKTLKHKNIIKFYASWIDTKARNINFVTEMFTSGSLRQYRQKHKRVDIRAVKNWARQILRGLLYLHSHDPPIIHRDLKCDNIFVNGNQGAVKIGDLGLAAILRKSQLAHTVIGTPEFMAPELYEEEYNELVDIYAFGMCLLEMLTFEYPYSECSNPVQIYKKVIAGKKPESLYKVKDPQVREFIEKCIASVSSRRSAKELLMDPFLREHSSEHHPHTIAGADDNVPALENLLREAQSLNYPCQNGIIDLYDVNNPAKVIHLPPTSFLDQSAYNMDFTVKGKRRDDHTIHLRLRILDSEGRIRNIYFPFDVKKDTAISVASEMVAELDLTDQDVTKIADMIDGEIMALGHEWKSADDYKIYLDLNTNDEIYHSTEHASSVSSESSLLEFVRSHCCADSSETPPCTRMECAAMHGRFEEVTFQVAHAAEPEYSSFVAEDAPPISSRGSSELLRHDWVHEEETPSLASSLASSNDSSGVTATTGTFVETFGLPIPNQNRNGLRLNKHLESLHGKASANNSQDSQSTICHGSSGFSLRCTCHSSGQINLYDEDEKDDCLSRELRLLAIKHQQELRELQRRHEYALLKIEHHLQKQKQKAFTCGPLNKETSTLTPDDISLQWEMSPKGRTQQNNGFCRSCTRKTKETLDLSDVKSKSRKSSAAKIKIPRSDAYSNRSSVYPSQRSNSRNDDSTNSSSNQRLQKMLSFGDVDFQLLLNSLSREVERSRRSQTVATENITSVRHARHEFRRDHVSASLPPRSISSPTNQ